MGHCLALRAMLGSVARLCRVSRFARGAGQRQSLFQQRHRWTRKGEGTWLEYLVFVGALIDDLARGSHLCTLSTNLACAAHLLDST